MSRPTAAALVTALAVVGLVVSLTAALPGLAARPTDRVAASGRAVAAQPQRVDTGPGAPPPARPALGRPDPGGTTGRNADRRTTLPEVGRSDATALRSAASQRRTPRPVRVELGSVDIDARIRPVGVSRDGQMQLPRDPRELGWYRFGTSPGAGGGTTVLAGHLDAEGFGLGPLVRLRDVEVADVLTVQVAGGRTRTYEVARIRRFDRQGLPSGLFSRSGPERLHLITCGGAYDADNGGYQQNLVVTAVPAG